MPSSAAYLGCCIISVLSILTSASLFILCYRSPRLRSQPFLLPVCWLSLSDLVWAVWALISYVPAYLDKPPPSRGFSCALLAWVGNTGALSSFFWYAVITRHCIAVITWRELYKPSASLSLTTTVCVWAAAIFFTSLPAFWGSDGLGPVDDGYECWIPKTSLRLTYYGPLALVMLQAMYLLVVAGRFSYYVPSSATAMPFRRRMIGRIVLFVFVFVLCWGEAAVCRVIE
jgi:hypothetical protein